VNEQLFDLVNHFARDTPWLHAAVLAYAGYGVILFALLLVGGWWIGRRDASTLAAAVWAPFGMLLAVGIAQPIAAAVREPRPYTTLHGILVLAAPSADPSFPSDHATMAGAVAAGLLLVSRRLGLFAVVAAVLMAAARVYIAAHYPLDVITGLALGATVTLLGFVVLRRPVEAVLSWLGRTPLRPLLRASERPVPVGAQR